MVQPTDEVIGDEVGPKPSALTFTKIVWPLVRFNPLINREVLRPVVVQLRILVSPGCNPREYS